MLHNRKSNRLKNYDYSKDNLYFITSCVKDRINCLGEIKNRKMNLNVFGEIAQQQWYWLEKQYPYIVLHAFVVMPNHIHGIIEINRVGTGRDLSLHTHTKIKSLSEIMGAYKTTVSKQIHRAGLPKFQWQRSFYDNIIRNQMANNTISRYIENNPAQWEKDKFNIQ